MVVVLKNLNLQTMKLKKYLFVDLLFKSYGDRMILQRLGFYFFLFFFFIFINFLFINTYFSKFFKPTTKYDDCGMCVSPNDGDDCEYVLPS